MDKKKEKLFRRKSKIRSKISGSAEKPRLTVYKSQRYIYAQIINDQDGKTICSAYTGELVSADEKKNTKSFKNIDYAVKLGKLIADKALKNNIQNIVFDRNGKIYHGRIKSLAEAARQNGLKF
ncbi:MAG: 50S ribosomal protein L18 [Spirochaetes bacterium GWF1_41_5]|nr:MAG: 50S ribosomal protein L18 [Spirochaetes bacterium GWF1_41_5]HBE03496.1 50S ribosomal protein L18 [Spirochaetia bacterium]